MKETFRREEEEEEETPFHFLLPFLGRSLARIQSRFNNTPFISFFIRRDFIMHVYRQILLLLHMISAICSLPHLFTHITRLSFRSIPLRSQIAYFAYWLNYSFLVSAILFWSIWVILRRHTVWQVIQVSAFVLIIKLVYTLFDVTTRILLEHRFIVIVFDLIHCVSLCPAILVTFLLVQHVKRKTIRVENH